MANWHSCLISGIALIATASSSLVISKSRMNLIIQPIPVKIWGDQLGREFHCKGGTFYPNIVVTARHCLGQRMFAAQWPKQGWQEVRTIKTHPVLDLALLEFIEDNSATSTALVDSTGCQDRGELISLCDEEHSLSALKVECDENMACYIPELEINPGDSGCPLINSNGRIAAIAVASSRRGTRIMCIAEIFK